MDVRVNDKCSTITTLTHRLQQQIEPEHAPKLTGIYSLCSVGRKIDLTFGYYNIGALL